MENEGFADIQTPQLKYHDLTALADELAGVLGDRLREDRVEALNYRPGIDEWKSRDIFILQVPAQLVVAVIAAAWRLLKRIIYDRI